MLTATHKQKVLTRLLNLTKRSLDVAEPDARPVFEQLLYAVCRENVSRTQADQAFRKLQTLFYDWNEIRVSSVRELDEAFAGFPDVEGRATRLVSLLQEVFESTYAFDLEALHKKGLKQAEKQLERYQGANRYLVSSTLQIGLGGHALPCDAAMQRTLRRLDLLDGDGDDDNAGASMEHLIPKARGALFCETVSALAHEYCWEDAPCCSSCPLNDVCPAGQANLANGATAGRASLRTKPR